VAGGWSLNIVAVLQSGYPLAITQPNNNSVIGAAVQRPNATGLPAEVDAQFDKRLDGWINPAAFSVSPQFTFGNISRMISLRGPGQINFDSSLFMSFILTDMLREQVRSVFLLVSSI